MNKKEKAIVREAFDILKREIIHINNYHEPMNNIYNYAVAEELKKLTRISIPGFGCFYISVTNAAYGKSANPALDEEHYSSHDVMYFRTLRFRPYKWTLTEDFRMASNDSGIRLRHLHK
jgi:nucleoid DNA-binding protein